MTTSTNNSLESREGVRVEEWEDDTLGDTSVEQGDGGSRFLYTIHDATFEDAWVESDLSKNLKKMR
jgi:hypothetical protein